MRNIKKYATNMNEDSILIKKKAKNLNKDIN